MPGRIVKDNLSPEDKKAICYHLATCAKTEANWDQYRVKIPEELLSKFSYVVTECRKNGFINPVAIIDRQGESQILWSQILADKPGDRCTMCNNTPCHGQFNQKGDFEVCWL